MMMPRRKPAGICRAPTFASTWTWAPAAAATPRSGPATSALSTSASTASTAPSDGPPAVKDFLSVLDLGTPAALAGLLDLAVQLKADRHLGLKAPTAEALNGSHVALLFRSRHCERVRRSRSPS